MIKKSEIDIIARKHVQELEVRKLKFMEVRRERYTPIEMKSLINNKKEESNLEINNSTLRKADEIIEKAKEKILLETIDEEESIE